MWEKEGGGWERRRSKERGEGRREKGEEVGTSNTKFKNVFLEHVINICDLHKQEKRDRNARKKQLFMEIEFLKINDKINILKIAISHF